MGAQAAVPDPTAIPFDFEQWSAKVKPYYFGRVLYVFVSDKQIPETGCGG